jgi:hypothetical protein
MLHAAGGRSAGLRGGRRLRGAVVVTEVALSFMLLVGAGLMLRSVLALSHVNPGYDPTNVLTFLLQAQARETTARAAFIKQVRERLLAIPGVVGVTAATPLPLDGGIANGRVYLLYTSMNRKARGRADTNIALRYSNDNGRTWSVPRRINDDAGYNSQFLPRLAVDQTTGHLGMSWHDCRMDNGAANSTDAIPNNDAQLWAAIATPTATGLILSPNFQVSAGTSNANRSRNEIDYGDYTGLAFQSGVVMPISADNSNSSGDNPAGRLRAFDIYTAKVSDPMTA